MLAYLLSAAIALAAIAPATAAQNTKSGASAAPAADLIGVWEPATVSSGGMGQIVEFTTDGRFLQTVAIMPDGYYRLIGDRLVVDEHPVAPDADTAKAPRITVEGNALTQTGPDGSTVRLERVGQPEPGKPAIIGVWIDHRIGNAAYTRYSEDGRCSYRVPIATKTDRYRRDGDLVIVTGPDRPAPVKLSATVQGDRLFLSKSGDAQRYEYRRIADLWYDRDLGNVGVRRSLDSKQRLAQAEADLAAAGAGEGRFGALPDAALLNAESGPPEKASALAEELLRLAARRRDDPGYGDAIHKGNLALGLVALHSGNVEEAKKRLLAAGATTGSGTLDTFGPNMVLAKELLEKGERGAVLEYLELCRGFWKMDRGQLSRWEEQIRAGLTPDFGANLLY